MMNLVEIFAIFFSVTAPSHPVCSPTSKSHHLFLRRARFHAWVAPHHHQLTVSLGPQQFPNWFPTSLLNSHPLLHVEKLIEPFKVQNRSCHPTLLLAQHRKQLHSSLEGSDQMPPLRGTCLP